MTELEIIEKETACDMLLYPYVLKQTLAIGLPGNMTPIKYSVMMFSPGV